MGTVISVGDGISSAGLEKRVRELIEFAGGLYGMVLNLEEDNVEPPSLADYTIKGTP